MTSVGGKPFTTGWKVAVVVALLAALGNGGVDALSHREKQRFHNHERRINELERKVRELQRVIDKLKATAPEQGGSSSEGGF